MAATFPQILGVLNVTRDSFSDGGRFLDPAAAAVHGRALVADGADYVDVGAESTHPDGETVTAAEEIGRLTPVVTQLKAAGCRISLDTYKSEVFAALLPLGVDLLNDVSAGRDPALLERLAETSLPVIMMHSTAARVRADRKTVDARTIVDDILRFFADRLDEFERRGVAADRVILDPGLGLFIGSNPEASVAVLRGLPRLLTLGRPLCLAASRKSFVGALLARHGPPRPTDQRGAGSLAIELWAAAAGVAYLRTHEPRSLRDALTVSAALGPLPPPSPA